jgi:hypothetical protein
VLALVALTVFIPYDVPLVKRTLTVAAIPSRTKTFTAAVAIMPTGKKVYPTLVAHGLLTITNGSIIAQVIPAGFTVGAVATDYAVFVPAGSATGYGYATVAAHALTPGKQGNIATDTVNYVEGSSVYIRNLSPFTGGRDAYSVKVVTAHDKAQAITKARAAVAGQVSGLHYPCKERYVSHDHTISLRWRCQIITYNLPPYMHVVAVKLYGNSLILTVQFVARPAYIWVK